jgi:hypothetical protein
MIYKLINDLNDFLVSLTLNWIVSVLSGRPVYPVIQSFLSPWRPVSVTEAIDFADKKSGNIRRLTSTL